MDKIYRRKLLKMAIASPLAFSLTLVLDIDPGLSFLGPLMVLNVIWLIPEPIGLKRVAALKLISLLLPLLSATAFVAGLWGINSIVLFFYFLLAGWGIQTWMPSYIGLLSTGFFLAANVLMSTAPFTTTVYVLVLLAISLGMGWSVDRLFWPILAQQGIERQVSETFRIFQDLSDRAFHRDRLSYDLDLDDSSLSSLVTRAGGPMRSATKALKIAGMTGSLSQSEREHWQQAITLQERLLAHLLAISRLLQENQDNPLLHELATELLALGNSLSATFTGLSVTIVDQHSRIQLPNPNIDFQRWQNQLNGMRATGTTQLYNLASRLAVGLIEHRLEGLISDLSKILSWLETSRSAVPNNLPITLELTR